MRSEELVVAGATAHGVDLLQAARVGTPPAPREVALRQIRGTEFRVLLEPRASRARGAESRTFVRPSWTVAEVGQAGAGVPEILFQAALFAFAGSRDNFWKLHRALCVEALALRASYQWPSEVIDIHGIDRPYLKHLAKLVLDEDASPNAFQIAPGLYALYLGLREKTWDKTIAERFYALKLVWLGWLQHAASIMQPRLSSEDGESA
jgi:hypothetical protein